MPKEKRKPVRAAVVWWIDHSSFAHQTWRSFEELEHQCLVPVLSCGIVLKEDKEKIILALSVGETNYSGDIVIAKKLVKKIKRFVIK